ncbi:unnamed protein product [Calypogeia fissa]
MKFISSNSKPHPGVDGHLPSVTFVLTHMDTLDPDQLELSKQWADWVVSEVKNRFQGVIDFCETVEVVNAHAKEDVERLLGKVQVKLKTILESQTEYGICQQVRRNLDGLLAGESVSKGSWTLLCPERKRCVTPGLKFEDCQEICSDSLAVTHAVLVALNDMGDVIYPWKEFSLVVNPRWFGIAVLGSLLDVFEGTGEGTGDHRRSQGSKWHGIFGQSRRCRGKLAHRNGFVKRKHIEGLLKDSQQMVNVRGTIPADTLVELMIHLELCFKNDEPGNDYSELFLPALFDDDEGRAAKGIRNLNWKNDEGGRFIFIGRRLECNDKMTTFLTPGFFPRLQVHLLNYIQENKWTKNAGFEVSRNLVRFTENGNDVCVEYSGDIDYFVDIMVRSSNPFKEALEFIRVHVIQKIRDFCATRQGCQGVLLTESVIRPVCVRDLHLCKDRIPYSVSVSWLKEKLEKEGDGYKFTWPSPKLPNVKHADYALELSEGKNPSKAESSSSSTSGFKIASSKEQLPMQYYLSFTDIGIEDRATTMSYSILKPVKLYLCCEYEDGHKVDGQPGRVVKLKRWEGRADFSFAIEFAKLVWSAIGFGTNIDRGIENFFDVGELHQIDVESLKKRINTSLTPRPASDDEILEMLKKYIDCTGGLQQILKEADKTFWDDFQLQHYKEIGWLCKHHFFQQDEWKSIDGAQSSNAFV